MSRASSLCRAAAVAVVAVCVGSVTAQAPPAAAVPASAALDGSVFVGHLGPRGAPDVDDELHFQDGQFWSSSCVRCGFAPGAYFVRRVGSAVHFRGEISGERGHFYYAGVVDDGRLRADVRWVKKRWYWTIDREFEFVGVARPAQPAEPAADALAASLAVVRAGRQCEP